MPDRRPFPQWLDVPLGSLTALTTYSMKKRGHLQHDFVFWSVDDPLKVTLQRMQRKGVMLASQEEMARMAVLLGFSDRGNPSHCLGSRPP